MSGGTSKFLRRLPCGIDLNLRQTNASGTWRRVSVQESEDYFANIVGDRVNDEGPNQKAKVEAKTGRTVARAVIE